MILNDSYYRRTCASNHFSNVRFVLKKGGTISYDVTGPPRQYSRNLEKLLRDQQRSYAYLLICALSSQSSYTRKICALSGYAGNYEDN